MIKEIIIIMFVFIIILAICIISAWYINSTAAKITSILAPIEMSINKDDWQRAKQTYSSAMEQWDKQRNIWKILVNHEELKDIEVGFIEVGTLLDQQNADETKKELTTLIFYLEHVPETEKLDLSNLF